MKKLVLGVLGGRNINSIEHALRLWRSKRCKAFYVKDCDVNLFEPYQRINKNDFDNITRSLLKSSYKRIIIFLD